MYLMLIIFSESYIDYLLTSYVSVNYKKKNILADSLLPVINASIYHYKTFKWNASACETCVKKFKYNSDLTLLTMIQKVVD